MIRIFPILKKEHYVAVPSTKKRSLPWVDESGGVGYPGADIYHAPFSAQILLFRILNTVNTYIVIFHFTVMENVTTPSPGI